MSAPVLSQTGRLCQHKQGPEYCHCLSHGLGPSPSILPAPWCDGSIRLPSSIAGVGLLHKPLAERSLMSAPRACVSLDLESRLSIHDRLQGAFPWRHAAFGLTIVFSVWWSRSPTTTLYHFERPSRMPYPCSGSPLQPSPARDFSTFAIREPKLMNFFRSQSGSSREM